MSAVSITVRDGTIYLDLNGSDPELWDKIIESTSFKLEGVQYQARHRGDKRTKLVKNKKAPVGLLDRICRTIVLNGVIPGVSYADTELEPKPQIALQVVGVEPRGYQVEAELAAMLTDHGIYRMPTGSGKTLVAAMIIAAKGHHALVVVPTIDLLHQTKDYLAACLQRSARSTEWLQSALAGAPAWEIGQLGDGVVNPQPVTVATIRTIAKVLDVAYEPYEFAEYDDKDDTDVDARALKEWIESLGTVIGDEAHLVAAKTYYGVLTKIPALYKYGMSASPWRDDGADLMIEAATGPPIFHVTAERMVREGYLMAPRFEIHDTASWWQSASWGTTCARCGRQWLKWIKECHCGCRTFRSQWDTAYRKEIVENPIRNARIARIVGELNRPTLVLVKQLKHGRELAAMIPGAMFLSGKDRGKERQAAFDAVRANRQQVIVCTSIADLGLDIPGLGALVLAGGGKSSVRHLQRIGRVVRPAPGKETPIVVDFDDSHIHSWFSKHEQARRKIELAEWRDTGATWVHI